MRDNRRYFQHDKTGERIYLEHGQSRASVRLLLTDPEHWTFNTNERALVHLDHQDPDIGYLREAAFQKKMIQDGRPPAREISGGMVKGKGVPRR